MISNINRRLTVKEMFATVFDELRQNKEANLLSWAKNNPNDFYKLCTYISKSKNDTREKYKDFFKIDFPRVPFPKDANTFWQLVKLGGELRQIHLS